MKEEFESELVAYWSANPTRTKLMSREQYDGYMECLIAEESKDRTAINAARANPHACYYSVIKSYGKVGNLLYKISANTSNIKDGAIIDFDKIVRVATLDEVFDLITKAHVDTRHSGAEITHKELCKSVSNISMEVVSMYRRMCACTNEVNLLCKRAREVKHSLWIRGQIDVIDMQCHPDAHNRFILKYQDLETNFIFLRALPNNQVIALADSLADIFCGLRFPRFLQPGNINTNTVTEIVLELRNQFRGCKLFMSKDVDAQLGNAERSCDLIKDMILAWMANNKRTDWSRGCGIVTASLNSTPVAGCEFSPYKLVFGQNMFRGFRSDGMFGSIETEEELEKVLRKRRISNVDIETMIKLNDEDIFDVTL